MKLLLVAFAVIAAVAADVSHLPSNEYLPPVQEAATVEVPSNEYLAPVQTVEAPVEAAHELADDGYRYKTQRRVVYRRNRRDVSHLPSNEYLPPVQESVAVAAPTNEYLPPAQVAAPAPVHVAAPAPVYSAPVEAAPAPVYSAPVEAEPAHELAADGYRYKTHRRVVYRRNRRDVSHLSNEYLPPVQESVAVAAPTNEYLPPVQAAPAPAPVAAPAPVYSAPVEAEPAHELADDGYRYKTHRRVVLRRHRRDVSHLPSNEYLPPVQEQVYQAPVEEVQQVVEVPVEAEPAHELADDGYRYKTHRRVVYRRNRRDVSHLPSNEYLPPVEESVVAVAAPSNEYLAPVEAEPAHELADDGYRYKTQRRVVLRRHRRDVSHLPSNEYLPPVQEQVYQAPVEEVQQVVEAPVEAEPAHELAADGYRYKTHRRVVYRRH